MKPSSTAALCFCIAIGLSACVSGERGRDPIRGYVPPRPVSAGTPRDAYAMEVERREDAATVRAWEEASRRALRSGLSITPSFRERIHFPGDAAQAVAYRFDLRSGERLDLRIDEVDADGALFIDVFQVIGGAMFRHVYAAPRNGRTVAYEAAAGGKYVVRLQPRIGKSGVYDVTTVAEPSTAAPYTAMSGGAFPVQGLGMRAIGSVFGDSRDGGLRSHEGVDIFAPRGTPVVAVVDGRVTGVQTTLVGGRVLWLTSADSEMLYYYAHLDTYATHEGASVRAGETLGTVGNTGNAILSRPHLHFGAYRPGRVAVDPEPLLAHIGEAPPARPVTNGIAAVNGQGLGTWTHVAGNNVRVRSAPSSSGSVITQISSATPVLLLGNVAGWHRVVLEDGTTGFVSATLTTSAVTATR